MISTEGRVWVNDVMRRTGPGMVSPLLRMPVNDLN
jgi:hypothetical protein